jgi:hypothetical protein
MNAGSPWHFVHVFTMLSGNTDNPVGVMAGRALNNALLPIHRKLAMHAQLEFLKLAGRDGRVQVLHHLST